MTDFYSILLKCKSIIMHKMIRNTKMFCQKEDPKQIAHFRQVFSQLASLVHAHINSKHAQADNKLRIIIIKRLMAKEARLSDLYGGFSVTSVIKMNNLCRIDQITFFVLGVYRP